MQLSIEFLICYRLGMQRLIREEADSRGMQRLIREEADSRPRLRLERAYLKLRLFLRV
jgi:hypothetical protein